MMEPEAELYGATLRFNEYAWQPEAFPLALNDAIAKDLACIGGQFQFRLPDATCELYWINAVSTARETGETWKDYVARSIAEVRDQFEWLLKETDFFAEADRFELLCQKRAQGLNLLDSLWFVAYFSREQDI